MVLTDRQKSELHAAMVAYLEGAGLKAAAQALQEEGKVEAEAVQKAGGLLEKKWTSVLRLQKKVMQLEEENKNLRENAVAGGGGGGGAKRPGGVQLPLAPAVHLLKGHRGAVADVAFHPLYPLLASASEDATVKIWDAESGEFERTLKGHTNAVNAVTFSPANGSLLASASSDLSIKLWNTETWDCVRTLQGHDHAVSDVLFVGDLIVSCSRDHNIKLWDSQTGYCTKTLKGHSEWVRSIAPNADGSLLVSGGHDKTVRIWNLANGAAVHELFGHDHVIEAVAFAPPSANPWIEDLENAKDLADKQTEAKYCASASRDKTIKIWDVTTGQPVFSLSGHENWVRGLQFAGGGKYLMSVADDYSIRIWDLSARRQVKALENAHDHFVSSIAYSTRLGLVATSDVDGKVKVWGLSK